MNKLTWTTENDTLKAKGAGGFEYAVTSPDGKNCLLAVEISWNGQQPIQQRGYAFTDGAKMECESHHAAILSAIAEAVKEAQPKWIACSERLPESDGEYLCLNHRTGGLTTLYFRVITRAGQVTHWMPNPAPPTTKGE